MSLTYLGVTSDNAQDFHTIAFHTKSSAGPVDLSNDQLLKVKCALLEAFADYLEVKKAVAQRRANVIVPGADTRAAQLIASADLVLTGYERDLMSIESILRAAEKMVESYNGTTFDANTVSNYRKLLGLLRQQAQDRINLIDLVLFQEVMTQFAVLNIVP